MVAHAYHPSMQEVKAEDENSKSAQDKRGYLKKQSKWWDGNAVQKLAL